MSHRFTKNELYVLSQRSEMNYRFRELSFEIRNKSLAKLSTMCKLLYYAKERVFCFYCFLTKKH